MSLPPTPGTEPTTRELEVLAAFAFFEGTKAAASHLGITYWTLRRHLADIRERSGVTTTAAAVYRFRDRLPRVSGEGLTPVPLSPLRGRGSRGPLPSRESDSPVTAGE